MTHQELFDLAWNHFIVNKGEPSYIFKPHNLDDPICRYRKSGKADDPCRCMIGLAIPDEDYDPKWEGQTVSSIIHELEWENVNSCFAMNLQGCHDDAVEQMVFYDKSKDACRESMARRMRKVAKEWNLKIPGA